MTIMAMTPNTPLSVNCKVDAPSSMALGIIYAVALMMLGIEKIQTAVDQHRLGNDRWYIVVISAVIAINCALVIFFNPFATTVYLWVFTGISLIVEAVADIIAFAVNRKKA